MVETFVDFYMQNLQKCSVLRNLKLCSLSLIDYCRRYKENRLELVRICYKFVEVSFSLWLVVVGSVTGRFSCLKNAALSVFIKISY